MINFLIYHHSQKYSFTRRPNTQLYMQFACYRKQKIKKFINPQSRQQQNASPSPYHPIGTTSHIPTPQNTTTSQQPPVTTTKNSLKKSPRGVQRGRGFTAPLRFSTASQSKKTRPSAKQESKNKTKNQPHNKQRKRKSQRKIKKKNKRKNKGEKA